MSNQLVSYPYFQVYRLQFQSGCSYVGFHKVKSKYDNYITSSSYFKNHPEDKLLNREILITTKDEFQASFLETWCILSDKAYNPKFNVNYNLGNFYHRFSNGFRTLKEKTAIAEKVKASLKARTPEQIKKSNQKRAETWSARTPEQKELTRQKYNKTMSSKTSEELAEIYKNRGRGPHSAWLNTTEEQLEHWKSAMSKSKSKWFENATEEQILQFKNKCSKIRKEQFLNMSEKELDAFREMCKQQQIKIWANTSKEEKKKRCKGFYEQSEKRKQKVKCIETGEVFNSLIDVQKWLGPKVKGCNISAQARGLHLFAYRHPVTKQPLHWELVNN